jgi:hypothetical protein
LCQLSSFKKPVLRVYQQPEDFMRQHFLKPSSTSKRAKEQQAEVASIVQRLADRNMGMMGVRHTSL